MVEAICALHHDRKRLKDLGEAAYLRISRDFDDVQYGQSIENAYVQALAKP
jgi:hypothetical protein